MVGRTNAFWHLGMMLSFFENTGAGCAKKSLVSEVFVIGPVDLREFSGPDLGTMNGIVVASRVVEQPWGSGRVAVWVIFCFCGIWAAAPIQH